MTLGGLGLQNVVPVANLELSNFKEIRKDLTENVIMQYKEFQNENENIDNIKKKLKAAKILSYKTEMDSLQISLDEENIRCNEISNKIGTSNWLSVIFMK